MQVGIGLSPNGAAMDDVIAAQVEWYLSRANLPSDDFLKSHMDPDLWVSLELILTFPRMVRLGARDKNRVALLLHARSADIEVDLHTYRIRPAWALRSHLLVRGVPHTATEADLAALLRIPYVAPPAPDTTSPTLPSPPTPHPAPSTSESASSTSAPTGTLTDAPHFRGLMSVMQVSMAGEWVAVFSARGDAAAALPHVDGQIVCGQPISAEVFIEGLEPHAVPAPSAVYQAVPSYYSHTHPHHSHLAANAHHQLPSTIPPSSAADMSQTNAYSHMAYAQSQPHSRSHIASHVQPYAPYSAGRARATSENGDGDDSRHTYAHHHHGHGHGNWQRTNGHRVNGHRRGGTAAYSTSHGGAHSNATRGSLANSTHNDRSRSPSAMSSLSATNGSTNRRPRRLTRRPTRRGSPGDGTFSRSSVQQNGGGHGHPHGQQSYCQDGSNAPVHRLPEGVNNGELHKHLNTSEDVSPGHGQPGTHISHNIRTSSAVYDHYRERGTMQGHGLERPTPLSSAAIVAAGANVAAMDFPPLQSSAAAGTRASSIRLTPKQQLDSSSSITSAAGKLGSLGDLNASSEAVSADGVPVEPGNSKTENLGAKHNVSVTESEPKVQKSDGTSNIDVSDVTIDSRGTHSSDEGRLHSSSGAPSEMESKVGTIPPGTTAGKLEPQLNSSSSVAIRVPESLSSPNEDRSDDWERKQPVLDISAIKLQGKDGTDPVNSNAQVADHGPGITTNASGSTVRSTGNGNFRKAPSGGASTTSRSYAAILLSPPRTPTVRKDSGRSNSNAKSSSKSTSHSSKGEGKHSKVNGKVNGNGGKANGGAHGEENSFNGGTIRNDSGNIAPSNIKTNGSPTENGLETVGSGDGGNRQTKGVRRPPRSPSVWAHKPASVVKAGPAISTAMPTGYSTSFSKSERTSSGDSVGNGSNYSYRTRTGRAAVHANGSSHAHAFGNVHHAGGSHGPQQSHAKHAAVSSQVRSQGSVPPQASASAQTPAASHARTVVG